MYRNKKSHVLFPLLLAVVLVFGLLFGMTIGRDKARSQIGRIAREMVGKNNKLSYTLSLIDRMYVDSVNTDSIVEKLMPELMRELDPHSVYIPAAEMGQANEALDGEFEGIGVVFNMATDTIVVLNVIPQGPSYKAGIVSGDRIVEIDDSLVAGRNIPQDRIMKMLRGPRGTTVKVSVLRQGIENLVPITIMRDKIPMKSIDAAFMLTPQIGFVKLSAFSKNSHAELLQTLDNLRREGMTGLIFDLRGNNGGFLDQAILLANEFLPAGKKIVYTEDRFGQRIEEFSDGRGQYSDLALAVLVDEGSASSSEILAGAIQDNDRGTVVGRRSYGKGLVQQQIPFTDGSAIRLTVARYYTPTGRSIQKPYNKGESDYANDIINRYLHNEMFSADSIRFADSLKFVTEKGKIVYGGGGIMPDIFVPLDTTDVSRYFIEVTGRNILFRYTLEYADRHRAQINRIKTVSQLDKLLDNDLNLLDDFIAYAARMGVAPDRRGIEESKELLVAQLRAYIGRNTPLEDSGFYYQIADIDTTVQAALHALE